jgi:ATP-dependent RNA helicase RhlE
MGNTQKYMTQNILVPRDNALFKDLGISENILRALDKNAWTSPTPIQHKVIPTGLAGKDIIGIAQTGTGKTLAFGIPMVQQVILFGKRGLIVVPTRELAIQVDEVIKKIGGPLGIYTAVLIGGEHAGRQLRSLKNRPEIVIATPGRLIDIAEQGGLRLENFNVLVLDEADRMFDIGFLPQIKQIIRQMPKKRQTMLFSATMPPAILSLATENMILPIRIEVAPPGTTVERVEQEIVIVARSAKFLLLTEILSKSTGPILIFTRTKNDATNITRALREANFPATEIHSGRTLVQRRAAMDGFKRGKYRIMVATDIAARGIDVKNIEFVINFDLPEQTEDYVHRIGRTARAGHSGKAISFAMPDQHRDILMIERLIKKTLPKKSYAGAVIIPGSSYRPGQNNNRRGGSRGGSRAPFRGSYHSRKRR